MYLPETRGVLTLFRPATFLPGRACQPRDAPPARVVILDGGVPLVFEF